MSRHFLVPVDGSAQSEAALTYVLEEFPEATITLVHVVTPVSSFGYGDDGYFDFEGYREAADRKRERGEEILAEARDTAEESGVDVETVLATGQAAREILDAADEAEVDHIVMGSHGRTGVERVLLGSVAETVTRRAGVPVTIVR